MNQTTGKLFSVALAAGALTACLRFLLYRVGFDEKNILSSSHPLHLICLALAGFMALFLFFVMRKPEENHDPGDSLPTVIFCRCSMAAAGCLFALQGIRFFREVHESLDLIRAGMALAAACSMILRAVAPIRLRTLRNLCLGIISLFFALDILCRYRAWSGNPQLPDYVFQVFACVLLAMCSYHQLAFDVGLSKRRGLLRYSLMALYLCLACISGPETQIFYLGGALWAGSSVFTGNPPAEIAKEEAA